MSDIFEKFFTGINYWASRNATRMWIDYDPDVIENDMRLLRDAGITVLRVFPTWNDFQPLTAFPAPGGVYEYGLNGDLRPDTEAGRAGVSREMCERFENFCNIAEKYEMKLIVAVLTGHMSLGNFIPPALVNLNVVTDAEAVRWEIRYIKYFVTEFKDNKAIAAWDLGNEVENLKENCTEDEFYTWMALLANTIKAYDSTRPVVSGIGCFEVERSCPNLFDLGEICDINTVHAYNALMTKEDPVNTMKPVMDHIFKCRLSEDIAKRPTFLQEFGALGYTNCSAKSETEFYRGSVLSALAHGFYGVMYWCAFDQGHLTFPPYNWNNIGSNYGFYDKDLKIKPIAEENIRLKKAVDAIETMLPAYKTNCTILVPRDEGESPVDVLRAAYMLAKRANLEPRFSYALEPIPDSELYIFPSVDYNKAITNTRLTELLKKVENGAVLYISLGNAHFRNIWELAGVTIDNREDVNKDCVINYCDKLLPMRASVLYDIEENGCEVIARDENESPVFVKNKYGRGCIYILFAPLEKYLSQKQGAFYCDDEPDYEDIYRAVSADLKNTKIADCKSKFICSTEHTAADGSVYIFAINYSNKPQTAALEISDRYDLEVVRGETLNGREVSLMPCDGILLRAIVRG